MLKLDAMGGWGGGKLKQFRASLYFVFVMKKAAIIPRAFDLSDIEGKSTVILKMKRLVEHI